MRVKLIPIDDAVTDYSYDFYVWIEKEISSRIRSSKTYSATYPGLLNWTLWVCESDECSAALVDGPNIRKKDKTMEFSIRLPHNGKRPIKPSGYSKSFRSFLEQTIIAAERVGIDASRLKADAPKLLKHFISTPEMIIPVEDRLYDPEDPLYWKYRVPLAPGKNEAAGKATLSRPPRRNRKMPGWNIPKTIGKIVVDEGEWETEHFDPLRLVVMPGTGRKPTLDWRIELDIVLENTPYAKAAEKIKAMGDKPDGHGWTELIEREFTKCHPKLAREFDSDSEMSTCVVLVKSEEACQKLVELFWSLIYPKN